MTTQDFSKGGAVYMLNTLIQNGLKRERIKPSITKYPIKKKKFCVNF